MKLQFILPIVLLHCGGQPFDSSSPTSDPIDSSPTTPTDESSIPNNPKIDASSFNPTDASDSSTDASDAFDSDSNTIHLCCATTANGLDDNCMSREPPSPLQPLPCDNDSGVMCAKELGMNCAQWITASEACPGYTVECE